MSTSKPAGAAVHEGRRSVRMGTLRLLSVALPTLAAAVFETGLALYESGPFRWDVVLGRTALMGVAALLFSLFMFTLIRERNSAILAERRRLEVMFQSASEAILLVDSSRRVVGMNPAAETLLGYRGIPPGLTMCQLCPNSQPGGVCPPTCDFDLSRPNPFFESEVRRSDGSFRPVAVSTSVLPAGADLDAQAMVSLSDVTERRELERVRMSRIIAARTLDAQEEERRRIARELHDGIGQQLYGLRLTAQVGGRVEDQAVAVMEEVQRLATSLYPPVLERLGLVAAVRNHAERLWRDQVRLEVAEDFPRLSKSSEAALFRIFQEAVGNAIRHGGARSVQVRLRRGRGGVRLEVEDDGSGFDPEAVDGTGIGLASMRERAESLGGTLVLRSSPGQGTLLAADLPAGEG